MNVKKQHQTVVRKFDYSACVCKQWRRRRKKFRRNYNEKYILYVLRISKREGKKSMINCSIAWINNKRKLVNRSQQYIIKMTFHLVSNAHEPSSFALPHPLQKEEKNTCRVNEARKNETTLMHLHFISLSSLSNCDVCSLCFAFFHRLLWNDFTVNAMQYETHVSHAINDRNQGKRWKRCWNIT